MNFTQVTSDSINKRISFALGWLSPVKLEIQNFKTNSLRFKWIQLTLQNNFLYEKMSELPTKPSIMFDGISVHLSQMLNPEWRNWKKKNTFSSARFPWEDNAASNHVFTM